MKSSMDEGRDFSSAINRQLRRAMLNRGPIKHGNLYSREGGWKIKFVLLRENFLAMEVAILRFHEVTAKFVLTS